jgi:hypothetical protein
MVYLLLMLNGFALTQLMGGVLLGILEAFVVIR